MRLLEAKPQVFSFWFLNPIKKWSTRWKNFFDPRSSLKDTAGSVSCFLIGPWVYFKFGLNSIEGMVTAFQKVMTLAYWTKNGCTTDQNVWSSIFGATKGRKWCPLMHSSRIWGKNQILSDCLICLPIFLSLSLYILILTLVWPDLTEVILEILRI